MHRRSPMTKFLICLLFPVLASAANIVLSPINHVLLRNEVSDDSVTKLQKEVFTLIQKRGHQTYTIYLVLDSPGGSIDAGLNLIESLKPVNNIETITLFAASMASGIVEALPGKRHVLETGTYMFHRARGGVNGQFEDGELESRLNFYKKMVRKMEQDNADRMKMSLDRYKQLVINELWIFGKDSVAQGAADEVSTITCTNTLINTRTVETFNYYGLQFQVEFSACPLFKGGTAVDPKQQSRYAQYKTSMKWGRQ